MSREKPPEDPPDQPNLFRWALENRSVTLTGDQPHRKNDPPESVSWARRRRGAKTSAIDRELLELFRDLGPMTTRELADRSGRERVAVSPRMAPLGRLGLVARTGERRDGCAVFGLVSQVTDE